LDLELEAGRDFRAAEVAQDYAKVFFIEAE
jgi:hypothetical protein